MANYVNRTTVQNYTGTRITDSIVSYVDSTSARPPTTKIGYRMVGNPPIKWRPPSYYYRIGSLVTRERGSWSNSILISSALGYTVTTVEEVPADNTVPPRCNVSGIFSNGNPLPNSIETVNVKNHALTQAMNAWGAEKPTNYGQMTFEARESGNYLARRYNLLYVLVHAGRTRSGWSIKRASRAMRLFSRDWRKLEPGIISNIRSGIDFWLTYQFAIKPLLADLYTAYNQVRKPILADNLLMKLSSTQVYHLESDKVTVGRWTSVSRASITSKATLWYRVFSPSLQQAALVGLTNPASIAWELMPLSFVADYMVPIGNTLSAMNAGMGTRFMGGSHSVKHHGIVQGELDAPSGWVLGRKSKYTKSSFAYVRDALNNKPLPRVYIKSPFSTSAVATAAALHASSSSRR